MKTLHKALTKLWLRKYRKKQIQPSVRAVFLGDNVSTKIILEGLYERFELEALENTIFPLLDDNSNCLDIGANIGNHACVFAKYFKNVYAFEPNPQTRCVLNANTIGRNIKVFDCGLSDNDGKAYFQQDFVNLGGSRIVEDGNLADFSIDVRTLDDVIVKEGISSVSFVKIDVEGHEAKVLQGGRQFFESQKPIIGMEAFFKDTPALGAEIHQILMSMGYQHFYTLSPKTYLSHLMIANMPGFLCSLACAILPERVMKTLELKEIQTILGSNHQVLVCSHYKLNIS